MNISQDNNLNYVYKRILIVDGNDLNIKVDKKTLSKLNENPSFNIRFIVLASD